ncbi:ttc29 [Acrasis kona]|uniref:Tetratricopeptide repeat protein 29 n=1 Tax=Acrasis kona TaxID=1008807 RepID=A0AAW2ZK42_9EUKA
MSFGQRLHSGSPMGVKLQPINLRDASEADLREPNDTSHTRSAFRANKSQKLPHQYENLKKVYSHTYRRRMIEGDDEDYIEQQIATNTRNTTGLKSSLLKKPEPVSQTPTNPANTLNPIVEKNTSASLTLPHHNYVQLKSKSRANIIQQQQQQELTEDSKLSDTQKKKDTPQYRSSQITRNSELNYNSPLQSVRVFGDEKSTVHSQRAKLCIETLVDGCIDAFGELFKLSHRKPVLVDPYAELTFEIPPDSLTLIKRMLVDAEQHRRNGDYSAVYDIYKEIADYFESEKDAETALHFHQLGQLVAKRSSDTLLEGVAHENMGKVYERLGETERALKSHEAHLSLADASRNPDEVNKARQQLWAVYMRMAKDSQNNGDHHNACVFYEKGLKTAKIGQNKAMMAESYHMLGKVYEQLEDPSKAIEYQKSYIEICIDAQDHQGQAQALSSLGQLYEQIEKDEEALDVYKKFLVSAEECNNQALIGKACEKVGLLMNRLNYFDDSIKYFERNYQLALQSDDKEWKDKARVKLGYARGNASMLNMIQNLSVKSEQS